MDGPVDGVLNMAVDRAIQLCREAGASPPTLRLYQWSAPTVTLGRFQPLGSVDFEACAQADVDIVRRFTGGRGVLHDNELTYSVVASIEDGIPRGTAASYARLSGALAAAYEHLGIAACLTTRDRGSRTSGACYLQTTRADLSHGATKLSGSAQVWSGSTVLQHGSLTISRDLDREASVFMLTPDELGALAAHTATITELLPAAPSLTSMIDSVVRGFEKTLGVSFIPGGLTGTEAELAGQLVSEETLTAEIADVRA